jgi:hypothetical protein
MLPKLTMILTQMKFCEIKPLQIQSVFLHFGLSLLTRFVAVAVAIVVVCFDNVAPS